MSASRQVPLVDRRAHRQAELQRRRKLEADSWKYSQILIQKELALHREFQARAEADAFFNYLKHCQMIARARWDEKCRLRAIEICENRVNLVTNFEALMREQEKKLMDQGLFIGSYTKKYLVCPVNGELPQLPPEVPGSAL